MSLASSTTTLDSYLDDDITIWIPPERQLSLGIAEPDAIRAWARPSRALTPAGSVGVHDVVGDGQRMSPGLATFLVVDLADSHPGLGPRR